MDFVKSVLDVLGGCIASHCAHAGIVVLLAKGLHSAKGQNDDMKRLELYIRALLVMHSTSSLWLATDVPPLALALLVQRCTGRSIFTEKNNIFSSDDGNLLDLTRDLASSVHMRSPMVWNKTPCEYQVDDSNNGRVNLGEQTCLFYNRRPEI
jgi:hypothetical protein